MLFFESKHNDIFCDSDGCMCLLNIEPTACNFTIIRKFIQVIVHTTLMLGRFPSKLNQKFILGLINKKSKQPDDFIIKMKSPIYSRCIARLPYCQFWFRIGADAFHEQMRIKTRSYRRGSEN